jgi:hypothetical protein
MRLIYLDSPLGQGVSRAIGAPAVIESVLLSVLKE